jgi:hypothetical protein
MKGISSLCDKALCSGAQVRETAADDKREKKREQQRGRPSSAGLVRRAVLSPHTRPTPVILILRLSAVTSSHTPSARYLTRYPIINDGHLTPFLRASASLGSNSSTNLSSSSAGCCEPSEA